MVGKAYTTFFSKTRILLSIEVAKQEAFEEKIKLKNQFRALDEDEVDFLDSIMESTRTQEANVKKETAEQLELFRRQREEAEKALLEDTTADVAPAAEGEDWKIASRKRRRDKSGALLIPGRKRKSVGEDTTDSSTREQGSNKKVKEVAKNKSDKTVASTVDEKPKQAAVSSSTKDAKAGPPAQPQAKQATSPPVSSLGLIGYSSDSE